MLTRRELFISTLKAYQYRACAALFEARMREAADFVIFIESYNIILIQKPNSV